MKKILLISNYVFHYRITIYNQFYDEFKKLGYEFHVLSNQYQKSDVSCRFIRHVKPFSVFGYIDELRTIKPDVVINFLHLKDKMIFSLTLYCRMNRTPMIYWSHGVNLSKADNKLLNAVYKAVHHLSSAIILYTPNQLKYIFSPSRKKTFIGYNTLCFDGIDRDSILSKEAVKKKYSIKEEKVILFISRLMPYKRLDLLLGLFSDESGVAVVVVGPGIEEKQMTLINEVPHYYYLGAKYGREVDEIYNMGDVFSTPGHIGLALVQAFFWGKPVVLLNTRHAPEIFYMKNGKNGYLVENQQELKEKILYLLRNDEVRCEFSRNAKDTIDKDANISKMFSGFREAVAYCLSKERPKL